METIERLAHARNPLVELRAAVGVRAQRAHGTNSEFERPLHFGSVSVGRVELWREEDGFQNFANVAVGLDESLRDAIDQSRWRLVRNKAAHKFGGDELSGRRMMGHDIQNHQPVFFSTTGRDLVAQHNLFAVVVHRGHKSEGARILAQHVQTPAVHARVRRNPGPTRRNDGPTREATRDFLHVFLGVAAVNAERMQFHQLARVIFIDAALL